MTWEPVGWVGVRGREPRGVGEPAVAPPLERAAEAVQTALRGLSRAADVGWTTPAAARYRAVLAEGTDHVRAATEALEAALTAARRHDVEVARASEAEREAIAVQALAWLSGDTG